MLPPRSPESAQAGEAGGEVDVAGGVDGEAAERFAGLGEQVGLPHHRAVGLGVLDDVEVDAVFVCHRAGGDEVAGGIDGDLVHGVLAGEADLGDPALAAARREGGGDALAAVHGERALGGAGAVARPAEEGVAGVGRGGQDDGGAGGELGDALGAAVDAAGRRADRAATGEGDGERLRVLGVPIGIAGGHGATGGQRDQRDQ
jgi:hypothetical protein